MNADTLIDSVLDGASVNDAIDEVKAKQKKPWKLKDTDLQYIAQDIKRSGYLLSKPIKTIVTMILSDYKNGYIDPDKHFPLSGRYENSVRLLNIVLHAHGLDQIKTLDDPLIKR
jgi:hypothetical protein